VEICLNKENIKIKFLKAFNGDSILLSFIDDKGKDTNILIDGGTSQTYKTEKGSKGKPEYGELKATIENIRESGQYIDLLIITHTDEDHIAGIIKWFKEDLKADILIKEIWFNSGEIIAKWFKEEENKDLCHYITEKTELTSINQGIEFSKLISEKGIARKEIIIQGNVLFRFRSYPI
jgi:glyoxylase-like metal-dependent hydrolase (beta-lactamase superfamily II)